MAGVAFCVVWLWFGLHLLGGLAGLALAGAMVIFSVGRSTHVKTQSDGTVLISYLIGSTETLQKPRLNAKYRHNSYDIELVDSAERVPLIERQHATILGNAKLGIRIAETLGLELHPELEAWLEANLHRR